MTQQAEPDAERGTPRRLHVELFVVHPTLDPAEITAALGMEPLRTHRVGDRRTTPKGTALAGHYPDTQWRYSVEHTLEAQWFAKEVAALVDRLKPHRAFLRNLRTTGGRACLIIQFLDDGYFGDEIPRDILATLVDLDLDLGIECF